MQDANNEQQQQRSTGSLKDKLRIPRPKSHSMGETIQQRDQYKSSNHQHLTINDREFGANNNEMTSLTRKADVNAASINVAQSRGVVKAGSSNDIGRASRGTPGSSNLEVGVRRGVNVYTPPGVPIVD